MLQAELVREGARQMTICNACRYCEGYCAVFPAMERRLDFAAGDMSYLANLCHNCGECLYACQYAPPHEFGVDIPRLMARTRVESYRAYAWPSALAGAYRDNGLKVALALVVSLVAVLLLAVAILGRGPLLTAVPGGNFYAVVPHGVMAWSFGLVGLFVLAAFGIGFARFWRDVGESLGALVQPGPLLAGLHDAISLRNLHAGGADCVNGEEERKPLRRWFHHLTFYGFMLCFAATVTATIYHYGFGWVAPYGYTSLPVILGTVGGIGLTVGPIGLYAVGRRRDAALGDPEQRGMDVGLIALLLLTSVTGLALLAFRETAAMGLLLVIHLGTVLALFVAMPYGKFVHGLYRTAALVKWALERRRPAATAGME
ncbi:MAG: tricarballylate utilization 4Fe-4S protein TcuB [Rubritepida sp.]|jgi:citrate/tricarballylate utilization protein|nr:tricarballylate utilization 4Fe-4S protein TcuB [Rubritepida sp.]